MQKLVTIYLRDKFAVDHQSDDGEITPQFRATHGFVSEHLSEELRQGWCVKQLKTISGSGRDEFGGYIVVLLEK